MRTKKLRHADSEEMIRILRGVAEKVPKIRYQGFAHKISVQVFFFYVRRRLLSNKRRAQPGSFFQRHSLQPTQRQQQQKSHNTHSLSLTM